MVQIKEFLINSGSNLGLKIIAALFVLFVGFKLANLLVKLFERTHFFKKTEITVQKFLSSLVKFGLKILVALTSISILGIPMTNIVALVASCGVAIGLALQGGLSNVAGGILILITHPFKVSNYIVTPNADGTVNEIGIFYTKLVSPDNKVIMIPNGTLMNSTVTVVNAKETRRVDLTFSVSYNSDIDKVREVIRETAENNTLVLLKPAMTIALSKQNESSIDFVLRVWVNTGDYWSVYFDLNEKIKKAFDENGIEIPYPQMDVHIIDKTKSE